ncbi:hypothetical protein [Clostridioides sp. ES-S-0001-03]|uniref:hypothetical protein n=1 Tax=Clostridioides sp. ES-S-0001-03 TaxID=2770771 RepID=UPI001D0CAE0A|nr:hypothetical protein [Clostridioides sp. ES-S-0001-03]
MIDDKITIKLNEESVVYDARLDMGAIAETQHFFKLRNDFMTVPEVLKWVGKGDFMVVNELIIQSILRCHKQLNREDIITNLKFREMPKIHEYLNLLLDKAMPAKEKNNGEDEIEDIEEKQDD